DAKILPRIIHEGVNLIAQVCSAHGIEEVEADGKLWPETAVCAQAKQVLRLLKYKIDARRLEGSISKAQHEAVFLRNAVKAPCIVWLCRIQLELLLHPLSAPW